jgi:hypothetical protein
LNADSEKLEHFVEWEGVLAVHVLYIMRMKEQILMVIERQPTTNTRLLAARTGTSRACVLRTLEQRLYSNHVQSAQELVPNDAPGRHAFSQWGLRQ